MSSEQPLTKNQKIAKIIREGVHEARLELKHIKSSSSEKPPKEHCDHECVCTKYIGTDYWKHNNPCSSYINFEECKHDTRAIHTSPPAPEQLSVEVCTICDIAVSCDRAFGRLGNPPCAIEAAKAAREQARKDVANEIWGASHRIYEGDLITDYGAMIRKLESLRAHQQQGGVSEG